MSKAVIFIPGIKGSKLYDSNTMNNEILWQDIRFNIEDFLRAELTSPFNGQYYDEEFTAITRSLRLEPIAYQEFWSKFEPKFKFVFPYDWRLPNKENGRRLKEFMQLIIDKSKASENMQSPITHFDVVTHSMGNMPLRYYILENGMERINKIIFVTPPFKGSVDSVSALVLGQGMFFNREETRKFARTLPALFELLPTYENYAIDSESSSSIDLWDINNWQTNLITPTGDPLKDRTIRKFHENLQNAKLALKELNNWNNNLSVEVKDRILVLVRTEESTLMDVVVEKNPADNNYPNYFDFKKSLYFPEGDGVVPNASSCHYCEEFVTYCFENRILIDDYKHPFILKDSRVQRMINRFLQSNHGASLYQNEILGRTVHRVKSLQEVDFVVDGVKHKVTQIIK